MSNATDEQKLFKLILGAIASDTLGREDYEVALENVRNGAMIAILEQILTALSASTKRNDQKSISRLKKTAERSQSRSGSSKSSDQMFEDVKRRKITRDRLEVILNSLDSEFLKRVDPSDTMRSLVSKFSKNSSDRQWQLFDSIINGNYEVDPYLDSMSTR